MSRIKDFLLQQQEEEQLLWEEVELFLEENAELFQQLKQPTPEEVIGYVE